MRESGILFPIFSLPSKYGIGCFSKEAYDFIDRLHEAGQSCWQILPLGPTGCGDSPYQALSAFAGNPYFIDPEALIKEGKLTREECDTFDFGEEENNIDYVKLYDQREELLRLAYGRVGNSVRFRKFREMNAEWLEDYTLFRALRTAFGNVSWADWDRDIRMREPEAMEKWKKKLAKEIRFYAWEQFVFYKQWGKLKRYAELKKVKIIGDIPIYVSYDSADCWANPKLFQLDEEGSPTEVAGCPPDYFCPTGQLWGNPLYRWKHLKKNDYYWWIRRLEHSYDMFDMLRIDHFRGFDAYYAISSDKETAEEGQWKKGPGYRFFKYMKKRLGNRPIIAEDLGVLTDSVRELVNKAGYPGMKVLQFAFTPGEKSEYLPHTYPNNCVVYTGTHDNDTTRGWYETLSLEEKKMVKDYLGRPRLTESGIAWELIMLAQRSVADLCIVPMQDYLNLGNEARINLPGTVYDNWSWRISKGKLTPALVNKIRRVTELCGRI